MKRSTKLLAATAIVPFALLIAGCGGDDMGMDEFEEQQMEEGAPPAEDGMEGGMQEGAPPEGDMGGQGMEPEGDGMDDGMGGDMEGDDEPQF
ncbi:MULTISPECIES: hypothetical protein [Thioalkalivibrio]|uniref:DNA primase n=1 Tax=Thioalkalivibrio halophilus TaxID=252474 RepID=A0A1V2ZZ84_9GAMM|nr:MULTISPECIES: hypothetical protein [Thioalkalivibrio]OOC10410.1 hypothetical protein B1A74_06355 [Thioalkalivibrio halophilus]PYG02921.1 hypothetical protein D893_01259 [Thioalkalivibrio sp. ALE21]